MRASSSTISSFIACVAGDPMTLSQFNAKAKTLLSYLKKY
jgi:hypothetical protein